MIAPIATHCALLALLPCLLHALVQEAAARGIVYELPARGRALVPFRFVRNQVRLAATLNGSGPFQLVLDTGMPTKNIMLFRSAAVDALGFADSAVRVSLAGAGGSGQERQAVVVNGGISVAVGELSMSAVQAIVLSDHAGLPPTVDGIIGGALFERFVVHLDMDHGRLELLEPSTWSPPPGACVLPLLRVPGATFIEVQVAVDDEAPVAAQVVIDLGASHALSLNRRADGTFAAPSRSIEAPLGRGLSGVVRGALGRVRRLGIGPFAFDEVVASFPVAEHQNPGGFDFRDGNLGAGILKRFNVTFDYRSDRIVLERGQRFDEPFEHDMSGLAFDYLEDGTVSVHAVLSGSPAAEAGVEPGDLLLGIDRRALDALGEDGVREALGVNGAEVELTLRRGTAVLEKRLRLRRLL